jgi:transmembrane sensor
MTPERFEYLFTLYKANQLSPEDWEELRTAVRDGMYDGYLQEDLFQLLKEEGTHNTWNKTLESSMWEMIGKGIQEDRNDARAAQQVSVPFLHRPVVRHLAIAASLLLAITSVWLFRPRARSADPSTAIAISHKIVPGSDKAMLILSDGTQIALDSTKNGLVARQGSSSIIKMNGTLSIAAASGQAIVSGQTTASPKGQYTGDLAIACNTITTPRGGQFELILPDGSKVWLNSSSSLKFPTVFTGNERAVTLAGEAYFEIGKNVQMPFVVHISNPSSGREGGKVQVLGTSFNIMAYTDEETINTTLLQGSVQVTGGDQMKQLIPGQQAALNTASHQLAVRSADLQQTIAWKNGLFEFDHTGLPAIMRQLARWYDIEIVYRVTPDNTPLGGSISRNLDLKEALALLEANGINHFKIEGKRVIVLP